MAETKLRAQKLVYFNLWILTQEGLKFYLFSGPKLQERLEFPGTGRVAQFAERFRFDLPYPLACDAED
jgi:hypothetical protein